MAALGKSSAFGVAVCVLVHGVSACGGVEGARYQIDGQGKFPTAGQPESSMTLQMYGSWRDGGSDIFSLGSSQTSFSVPETAVGSWSPTSDPYTYKFSLALEVAAPPDGEEPSSASVSIHRPSVGTWGYGTVKSHEVSDAEDGWIPVHITAVFDFANTYY